MMVVRQEGAILCINERGGNAQVLCLFLDGERSRRACKLFSHSRVHTCSLGAYGS